jgi:16S rRNA (cytidine1402-2'-O)-methyltransferase
VSRELTKLHETTLRGSLDELAGRFDGEVKGEITLVVAGAAPAPAPRVEDLDSAILERIADGERVSQIAADLARETGLPKKLVYTRVLALRDSDS